MKYKIITLFTAVLLALATLLVNPVSAQSEISTVECEDRVKQSVVLILPVNSDGSVTSSGSGVVVDSSGLIYTNRHVVEEGEIFLIYLVENPNRPPVLRYAAVDYGFIPEGYADFAILQITQTAEFEADPQDNSRMRLITTGILPLSLQLQFVPPAVNTTVRQGDGVRIFGFPGVTASQGQLPILTRTQGQIVGIYDYEFNDQTLPAFYYTDASISPGNSGGIAINDNCEYVGVPTQTVTAREPGTNQPVGPSYGIVFPVQTLLHLATRGPLVTHPPVVAPPPAQTPSPTATPQVNFPDAVVAFVFAPATQEKPVGDWEQRQVYVMNPLTGNQPRQLTDCGLNWSPAISPDGTKIVYVSTCNDGNNQMGDAEMWVMNIDGSGKRQLTTSEGWEERVSWSPDGTRLVYTYSGPETSWVPDIYTSNADGSGVRSLATANTPGFELYPSWSPDGETIAFSASQQEREAPIQLCFVSADGTGVKTCPITYGTHSVVWDVARPAWTPDSQSVLYRHDGDSIYVAAIDGSNPQELGANVPAWKSHLYLSTDSRFLFFNGGFEAEGWFGRVIRLNLDDGQFDSFGVQGGSAWELSVHILP